MGIPLIQTYRIGRYLLTQKLRGRERFPLVLMLEPLFQCNLACAGCGKIDHPKEVLQRRMSIEQALAAVDECDAPVVSIPGGEPLIHRQLPQIVAGIVARRKFVYLCTNALLLAKHIDEYRPSRYLTFSIHLDGNRDRHDASVCQQGVYDKAVAAIRLARSKNFRVTVNCTLFAGEDASQVAAFFDETMRLGIEGITVSPGSVISTRRARMCSSVAPRANDCSGTSSAPGRRNGSRWRFTNTSLFLDFLAGNQIVPVHALSNPTYNLFGWQRLRYLLDAGYATSFRSLMEDTIGTTMAGRNARCDNCMAHCGFEGTAVTVMRAHPLKAMRVSLRGPRVSGPMAPELPVLYTCASSRHRLQFLSLRSGARDAEIVLER